eukprot:TRINITY_DN3044_c1_g2_i1.p1 TRINITY_DN3044_c1_g2~~TRINITY_DN3044_c1_g2_i1.p1  ORF type:complete len:457 (+),score=75.74 TRINITY_DN3044_c1_g2_i1:51-1421(+)
MTSRFHPTDQHPISTQQCSHKVNQVAKEIITSEMTYQKNLTILLNYMDSLRYVFDEDEVNGLFSNVESIKQTCDLFLDVLEMEGGVCFEGIGMAFTRMAPLFKLYIQYVNDFPQMNERWVVVRNDYEKNKMLSMLDRKFQFEYGQGLVLEDYLIMPIQRIPRYVLLLNDLLKTISEQSCAHEPVSKALEEIKIVAGCLNEKKSHRENLEEMYRVNNSLDIEFSLLDPSRKFIIEFDFVAQWEKMRGKECHIFCFNDMVVISEKGGIWKPYSYSDHWDINEKLTVSTDGKFVIMDYVSDKKFYTLEMENTTQAEKLSSVLQEQLNDLSENQDLLLLDNREDFFKPCICEGYMHKLGDGIPFYRKRYFRLRGNTLFYFINSTTNKVSGTIDLSEVKLLFMTERERLGRTSQQLILSRIEKPNITLSLPKSSTESGEWLTSLSSLVTPSSYIEHYLSQI